jgi:hypothetical protein
MKLQVSELWLEMALDAVEAARDHMLIQEFDRRAKLMPFVAEAGYLDRIRVLDNLIESRVIGVDERRLTLGNIEGVEWIMSGLELGNSTIWKIAEIVDRRRRVVRKFDADGLVQIGQVGEITVIEHLQNVLPDARKGHVKHVSVVDDSLGYDIVSPSTKDSDVTQLLEVKTSVRPGPEFHLFISRNEFRVGMNNPNWNLVCVRITDGQPRILGYLPMSRISDRFPIDQDKSVMWASCSVSVPPELMTDGLP